MEEIHVYLRNEGTDVWRPVEAEILADGRFRIIGPSPSPWGEEWQFSVGTVVRCVERELSNGPVLVAVEAVHE